jgi:hypothetical protein
MRLAVLSLHDGTSVAVNPSYIVKVVPDGRLASVLVSGRAGGREVIAVSTSYEETCSTVNKALAGGGCAVGNRALKSTAKSR